MSAENNTLNTATSDNKVRNTTFKHLFSSEEWRGYFQGLSKITGFDLSIYDENGTLLLTTKENPICKLIKSATHSSMDCPNSCERFMFEPIKLNEPTTYKCYAKIMNFSVPINYLNEKAVIVGRDNFASYEDFLEFLRTARDSALQEIPITTSLSFVDENYIKNISQYVHKTINYLLNSLREKHRLIEKIGRLTALMDTNVLERLSKNTEFIHRYIVDTIEFILGPNSIAVLVLDHQTSTYKTMCSTGKYKDALMNLQFDSENTLIQQLLTTRAPVFPVELEPEKLMTAGAIGKTEPLYLFPIFIANTMEELIGVFDRKLSQEDIKIIHVLCNYIEVTLENHALHLAADKKMEEILTSISELSKSIAPVLNWEELLQTILEKSIQLLKAEQGSLMLLNHETAELFVEAKKSIDNIVKANMKLRLGEGIAGKVLKNGEPLLVKDVEKDPRTTQKNKPRYKTKSFVSIPIKIEDRISGVLNISDKITGEVFDENDLKFIQSFSTNAAIAIERSLLYKRTEELKKLSITDPLTGILNRRYLNNRLSEEISRFKRHKQSFSFLMLDIDGFKEYNDTYGHITGDRALKNLATTLTLSLRSIDILARFGGDEFVIILPQTTKRAAINIANRLRKNIEKTYIPYQQELPFNITVSIGLTSYPEDASSAPELLEKTDHALLLAKKEGRNRLVYL